MPKQLLISVRCFLAAWIVVIASWPSHAQQTEYAYIGLEPDIITNYLSGNARTLGYVRVTVELMLDDADNLEIVEHHMPLMRALVIEVFGRQPEDKVKSLTGREDIRRTILQMLQERLQAETGNPIIKDVIFTKYLYQG
ncbi:flagellar basal body-associated protein FliL [Alteromonas oceanisediminis]|uniref:flagellar basal body-associated protein FliL n=1 Tax=Alteromonas oceanisediminis TaxID=2836180 RepID=UPI001BDB1FC6|nr:flagellar basal body-associated protein FliL [Alteromonas oceanisediminis]MBT0586764.1 flagellar basal body-associated protein FliL [Alteromonas oceanisediminis]